MVSLDTLYLKRTLPDPFADRRQWRSDLWQAIDARAGSHVREPTLAVYRPVSLLAESWSHLAETAWLSLCLMSRSNILSNSCGGIL